MKLVMIGGYDPRVEENVEVLTELEDLVSELGLEDQVTFKTSTPTSEKVGKHLPDLTGGPQTLTECAGTVPVCCFVV